jgi:hypothetical protein
MCSNTTLNSSRNNARAWEREHATIAMAARLHILPYAPPIRMPDTWTAIALDITGVVMKPVTINIVLEYDTEQFGK